MTARWMNGPREPPHQEQPDRETRMVTQFPDSQPTSWSVWAEVGGKGNGGVVGAGVGVGAGAADGTLMRRSSPGEALPDQQRPQDQQRHRLDGRVVLDEACPRSLEPCTASRSRSA